MAANPMLVFANLEARPAFIRKERERIFFFALPAFPPVTH